MAYGDDGSKREKRISMALALGVAGLVGAGLVAGFHPQIVAAANDALKVIDLTAPEPEQPKPDLTPVTREEPKAKEEEGEAAPPNVKSKAKQVTAPKPKVKPIIKSEVKVADRAGTGNDATQGSSDKAGPGTGAGGQGNGTGSGASGSGTGGGGGGGVVSRARKISGEIVNKDYPKLLTKTKQRVTVVARYTVGADGKPSNCRISKSSGYPDIDNATCRVIQARFRYEPARDASGRAVDDVAGWSQDIWSQTRG